MRPPLGLHGRHRALSELPRAIWVPPLRPGLPSCYQGSPLDMVHEMVGEIGGHLDVHDVIDLLLSELDDGGIQLDVPRDGDEATRAHFFITGLLQEHIAKEMPAG